MSSRFEISSVNKGLFNRSILQRYLTDDHRNLAKKITEHFSKEKRKNPYSLSAKQLNALSEDDTIDYYIKPILECLGYKYRKKLQDSSSSFPDIWLFLEDPEESNSKYLQRHNLTILEAKKYKVDLDIGDNRKETPPEQIAKYVQTNMQSNPNKCWGILSNGYKWRLYSPNFGNDKYIEFDIDHALENRDELELFCLIFSPASFKIGKNRDDLLIQMHTASLDSWVSITDEIQHRGNDVLLSLVNGFYEENKNLEQSKSLAYNTLFKLLYALYIESKHLIPKGSVSYYDLSLRVLLHDIYEATLDEFEISKRLNKLFKAYNSGEKILPAKFGGEHFESDTNIKLKNKWLRQALELLTVFSADKSEVKFFDYSSLNVELIGNIYEGTLGLIFKLKNNKVEIEKIKKKTGTVVHSTGTTYTPPNVVKYLIDETLPKTFKKLPTVCDPSCGSGHFLVQALRHLAKNASPKLTKSDSLQSHMRAIALNCLFGTDINPLASKLTRLMLVIETSERGMAAPDFRKNIKNFNSLVTKWNGSDQWLKAFDNKKLSKEKGFNFILGNPPYVRADEPGELENRKKIVASNQYKYLHKKWDLFIPFIELAVGLTKKTKGSIAYVVSNGITYAPYAEVCTADLSKSGHVKFVSHFSKAFPNWAFPATCFVIDQSKKLEKSERRIHKDNLVEEIVRLEKSSNAFTDSEKEGTNLKLNRWQGLVLSDLFYISVGMVLNSDEKLKNVSFKKDDLISNKPDKTHPIRYIDNEDIGFCFFETKNERYIEYGAGLRAPAQVRRPTFPELHNDSRILLSRSKKGCAAVLVEDDIIISDNTIVLKSWSELIGVENRAISVKAKLSRATKPSLIPKGISDRVLLEALSGLVPPQLILGILISDFFKNWINSDKRHKHVIVPDVVSEMPLPVMPMSEKKLPKFKYDLTFQTKLKNLERQTIDNRTQEIVHHIVQLVNDLTVHKASKGPNNLKVNYLNQLVVLLYAPVVSGKIPKSLRFEEIIENLLDTDFSIDQKATKSKAS